MLRMSITGLVCLFLFGYSLAIPVGELSKVLDSYDEETYPKVLEDPIGLSNLLVQWNKEGKIFLINGNNTSSYESASRTCQKYNMELVRIENEEKSRIINSLFETYTKDGDGPFWMAGSRLTDGETWRWMDDQIITYFNWAKVEPNNAKGDEMCIELYRDYAAWNDERCSIQNAFLCENILKKDSGYHPILDSNDIENEFDAVRLPSSPLSPRSFVSTTEDVSPITEKDESSEATEDEDYDFPEIHGTIDYYYSTTQQEIEAATEKINTDNSTTSTENQPEHISRNERPSSHDNIPPYIPPVDEDVDEYDYYNYDSKDTLLKLPHLHQEDYESEVISKTEPKESLGDKENYYINSDRVENARSYFGKEWVW